MEKALSISPADRIGLALDRRTWERGKDGLHLIAASVQHIVGLASFALFPLIVAEAAGASTEQKVIVFQTSFLALAITNLLQSIRVAGIGTGHLVPGGYTAAYLAPSLLAIRVGGPALVAGMTIFSGILEVMLSRVVVRVKSWIGVEVLGVILVLVGIANGLAGYRRLTFDLHSPAMYVFGIAVLAMFIATMIERLAIYAVLIGVTVAYVAASHWALVDLSGLRELPLLAWPSAQLVAPQFDASLALPFAVIAVITALKQTAFVNHARRMDGEAPDAAVAGRGVIADGIGTIVSGLLGSLGMNASASSAGIKAATGVTDRAIGFAITGLLLILASSPRVALFAALLPASIIASVLIYTAIFVLASGIREIGPAVDREQSLIVGAALLCGLAAEALPVRSAEMPAWLANFLGSSLAVGATAAIGLSVSCRLKARLTDRIGIHFDRSRGP